MAWKRLKQKEEDDKVSEDLKEEIKVLKKQIKQVDSEDEEAEQDEDEAEEEDESHEKIVVVREYPTQTITEYTNDDGVKVKLLSLEDALTKLINKE